MTKEEEKLKRREEEIEFLPVIDGEVIESAPLIINTTEDETVVPGKSKIARDDDETIIPAKKRIGKKVEIQISNSESQTANQKLYLLLPFIFLTVTLLGGLRLSSADSAFIFWRPALFCLIAAAILMVLFFRAGLLRLEGWFSEDFTALKNIANAAVLVTLFAASAQIFNALVPEQGLPFLVVAFCFFWTLVMNFFGNFDTRTFLKFLGAMWGLAFIVKYLILLNLTAPASESWLQGIFQNTTKEAVTWLLDLPRFSAGTGYIQFFTVVFYLLGLFLLPPSSKAKD
jgi:hypothetical protein